jgi:Family of unknown function (DUF5947)
MSQNLESSTGRTALASLRQFLRPRVVEERCELCDAELSAEHPHLVELSTSRLHCACDACAILFGNQGKARYRRVPRRIQPLDGFRLSDAQWLGLDIPINLAFFVLNTRARRVVALYPSPAGATESLPSPEAWQAVVDENPVLRDLEADVEALLVNRLNGESECYRVGIDECYKLVAAVRTHWRGLSGGPAVWVEVRRFFDALSERSEKRGATVHA